MTQFLIEEALTVSHDRIAELTGAAAVARATADAAALEFAEAGA